MKFLQIKLTQWFGHEDRVKVAKNVLKLEEDWIVTDVSFSEGDNSWTEVTIKLRGRGH